MKIVKWILLFLFSLLFLSCGASKDEQRADAILNAMYYIETGDCAQAISLLEGAGRDLESFSYVKALASSYACAAGYSTVGVFADIADHFGNPSILGGLSLFSNSAIAVNPDVDESFQALQSAINILMYAGGIPTSTEPSVAERAKHFTADEAGDINAFLFYLVMEQIGKYSYYYGNSSATGVKGSGTAGNGCFFNYNGAVEVTAGVSITNTLSGGGTGGCTAVGDGHPQLGVFGTITTEQVSRLCNGVVLTNTFMDTISGVLAGVTGGDLASIDTTLIDAAKGVLTSSNASAAGTILSQVNCESNYAADTDALQVYFVLIYETLFP